MSPWETAEGIVGRFGSRLSLQERGIAVNEIATAIQAASNEQLARNRDGHLADVREFFQKFNVPIAQRPAFPDQATLDLRAKLNLEEVFEFIDACGYVWEFEVGRYVGDQFERVAGGHGCGVPNLAKAVDGLLDMEYVTLGAFLSFGVDPAVPWRRVHLANMSKEGGGTREDGKICKPKGWEAPDIEGALRDQRIAYLLKSWVESRHGQ